MSKILIIEDNKNLREIIGDLFELKGHQIFRASDGASGVIRAIENKPDLIICDIMMPKMDGYEVFLNIREIKYLAHVPFIFLTAKDKRTDIREGLNLGIDDYITKPFDNEELIQIVETRLQKSSRIKEEIYRKYNELKNNTINNTSPHEYNTPLAGVIGSAELLLEFGKEFTNEELKELYESIYISAIRLKNTINNNVLFNVLINIESNEEAMNLYANGFTKNTKKVIEDTIEQLEEIYPSWSKFEYKIQESSLTICQNNLGKILKELIENAMKFSNKGSKIDIRGFKQHNKYRIIIKDLGRGMSEDEISNIGPFVQFQREKYEQQGLGLGLYIAKKLTEINEGEIKITSEADKGTTVELIFNQER